MRETLPILFRAQKEEGQLWITGVFPTESGTYDPSTFTIYQHIGQHGSATRGWYNRTRRATPQEYAPLLRELRQIYEQTSTRVHLRIVQRMTRLHDNARRAQIAAIRNAD
jgi:hypothetical protein